MDQHRDTARRAKARGLTVSATAVPYRVSFFYQGQRLLTVCSQREVQVFFGAFDAGKRAAREDGRHGE